MAIEELDNMVQPVMQWISRNPSRDDASAKGNAFIQQFPPERALKIAAKLSYANPFFVPDIPEDAARNLRLSMEQFAEFAMRAKMTARRADQPNILLACAPKSASTFIHAALTKALKLPTACLFAATLDWGSAAVFGSNLREQEPDELSLIRNGLNGRGYVAQHHTRCSPYLSRLLTAYNIRPIVTHRNIFDTVVSMDDMCMEWRANPASIDHGYFGDGLPSNYQHLDRADRLMILAHRHTAWLVQFYITWKRCERIGFVKPLWISYEQDFLGSKSVLAARIADLVGNRYADAAAIESALEDRSAGKSKRLNQGVPGRGRDLPDDVRAYILSTAGYYRDDEDMTALIGPELA